MARPSHNPDGRPPTTTPEQDVEIAELYLAGQSPNSIAAQIGRSTPLVLGALRRAGIVLRGYVEGNRKYTADHHYFDEIDTEAKAYWLGFLAADGCITDRNRLTLTIAACDRGHVELLRAALGSTHPIVLRMNSGNFGQHEMACFSIRSAELCAGLARYGVLPRKSMTFVPPVLREDLRRHFWRGMVDGDGFICRTTTGWSVGLVGTRETVEAFATFAEMRSVRPVQNIWNASIGGSAAPRRVADLLYSGAQVALARKLEKYAQLIAHDERPRFGRAGQLVPRESLRQEGRR